MSPSKTLYSFLLLSTALLLTACGAKEGTETKAVTPTQLIATSSTSSGASTSQTVPSSLAQSSVAPASESADQAETEEGEDQSPASVEGVTSEAAEEASEAQDGQAEEESLDILVNDYTAPAGSPGTGTGIYISPFPEELIGTWETDRGVRLTYQADGTVIRETYDSDGSLLRSELSHVGNSEIVGDGVYRFNDLSGDRAVVGGTGLGGGFPIEVGFQFNGDGTASTRVWQFDREQDPATYYYQPGSGIEMTRVE